MPAEESGEEKRNGVKYRRETREERNSLSSQKMKKRKS